MFAIAGRIDVDPAHHDAAAAAMVVMQTETRSEQGCQGYTFSADLETPGVFYIQELWEGDEALAAHFVAPHMKAFQAALKGCGPRGADVKRYDVSKVGPVRPER